MNPFKLFKRRPMARYVLPVKNPVNAVLVYLVKVNRELNELGLK